MIGKMVPLFTRGNILTKEMLEALKEYAVKSGELSYIGYSDGILRGCNITTTEDLITLNQGIMIFNEIAYYITEPMTIEYHPTNEWNVLKASLQGEVRTDNFISRKIELTLVAENQVSEDDIEICRFKLQKGARLRYKYKDFKDLSTEYDTINELNSKWAAFKETSISPKILQAFYEETVKSSLTDMQDISFFQLISNLKGEAVNRATLSMYICNKIGKEYQLCSNKEIYDGLREALRQLKGGKATTGHTPLRNRVIIVD